MSFSVEGGALPLRSDLHDLGIDRALVVVVRNVELDGGPRQVAVEEVVHAALRVHYQRDLDHHEVEFSAEVSSTKFFTSKTAFCVSLGFSMEA